ncbi:uncharacterized protein L3040_002521 [Drepanopeziza brunnea f. sp. 'multigermtubi']|uniref:DUF498 domain protein n=1 Tax=Marssonina brunnea f. sp. multigermtubi (strain MB_m1) TaxID=1072389 RepID=K1X317_MARBU|nr:DUF498 domain protein [Drepanopeziza brunnea f. sp. 'multigermtubi' MB_m1]EKD19601.1 DUF498 domain protein [Drepanopeziza brunnea f. sp. 'multigermtubi' MB_m1]KAJ5050646.1 hypothetical protein L3040_002521 [Drepanopeziza brunnea f. sp. 'multigermtubi']
MPPLHPLTRPTIRELSTFLFSPQPSRCLSHLARPSRLLTTPPPPNCKFNLQLSAQTKRHFSSPKPQKHDRGPPSTEDTQTDFGALNVLGSTPAPSTSIDACLWDGFHLDSGVKISGGTGVLLVGGEAFAWRPWGDGKTMLNEKGQWDVAEESWGLLGLVWPKPDLLILGLGKEMRPISPRTRQLINGLGIRVDIQDTRNAAAQFNLLATERGISTVAAAMVPIGWREGAGILSADD